MIVSPSINLTGFALCGLFHEPEKAIQTFKINIKLFEVNKINDFNKASKEMLSINFDIPSITNYYIFSNITHFKEKKKLLLIFCVFLFIFTTNSKEGIIL